MICFVGTAAFINEGACPPSASKLECRAAVLRRYFDEQHERIGWERKLARILTLVGEPAPDPKLYRGTAAGDERRLRGLPAIARGTRGAIAGTDPLRALLAKERRNGRGRA